VRHDGLLGVGIIGCGVIGPTHAEVVSTLPGAELVAVADTDPQRSSALAGRFGVVATGTDELLGRDDIDVVCVCVPSGLHAEIGARAAGAGKHVIVEKPIDVTLGAADRLIAAARAADVTLSVISQHRFDPGMVALRQMVDDGELGSLTVAAARVKWYRSQGYYDSGDWRGTWALDGGGALINQGIHYTDLLRWIMGPPVEVVALTATNAHDIEVEDTALALLRFESGAVATLEASTSVFPGLPERLEVSGRRGTAIVEDGRLVTSELMKDRGDVGAYGAPPKAGDAAGPGGAADAAAIGSAGHRRQIADVVAAIRDGREPLVTGADGRAALEVAVAVYRSAREGRALGFPVDASDVAPPPAPTAQVADGPLRPGP
jgi:UDP-N-acetyl-2-amino-2-deoxyglucuronate dehydrogenase